MTPETTEEIYETWLARRREEFTGTDLSLLVVASIRSPRPSPETRHFEPASIFRFPSTAVGVARLIFFVLLILTPA